MSTYLSRLQAKRQLVARSEGKGVVDEVQSQTPPRIGDHWRVSDRSAAVGRLTGGAKQATEPREQQQRSVSAEELAMAGSALESVGAPRAILTRSPKLAQQAAALSQLARSTAKTIQEAPAEMKSRLATLVPEVLLALHAALESAPADQVGQSLAWLGISLESVACADERQVEALVALAQAVSRSEPVDLPGALRASWGTVEQAGPQVSLHAARAVRDSARAGIDIAATCKLAVQALKQPNASAEQLLEEFAHWWNDTGHPPETDAVAFSRSYLAAAANAEALTEVLRANIPESSQPLFERASRLLDADSLHVIAAVLRGDGDSKQINATGEAVLAVLRGGAPPSVVNDLLPSLRRLAAMNPMVASWAARVYPANELSELYFVVGNVLEALPEHKKEWLDFDGYQALTESLAGARAAFADPHALAQIMRIDAAPDPATLQSISLIGPRTAKALLSSEPSDAKTLLSQRLAESVHQATAAGVDFKTLAVRFPSIAPEILPYLAAAGAQRGAAETLLAVAENVFRGAGHSRDASRALRNWLVQVEEGGGDSSLLMQALVQSTIEPADFATVAKAMLSEAPPTITLDQSREATELLSNGQNPVEVIQLRMQKALADRFGLQTLLDDPTFEVTERGLETFTGSLSKFFAEAAADPTSVPPEILQKLLTSVLRDDFEQLRFGMPAAQRQLSSLGDTAQKKWRTRETMSHVRFGPGGQERFNARVDRAAQVGLLLLAKMEAQWGPRAQLEARRNGIVEQLRNTDKGDTTARFALLGELGTVPQKLAALDFAARISAIRPEAITPLRYAQFEDELTGLLPFVDQKSAIELRYLFRITDLPYSEVTTSDGPDLTDIDRLVMRSGMCVRWPSSAALAYCVDANKRIITTKNQAGEERRAVLRLVERTDEGHVGEAMLVLERGYPDRQDPEEKLRLVEHALRRASMMGIAIGYPTEYYWNAAETNRGRYAGIVNMNEALDDLNRRYQTTSREVTFAVVNPAGNTSEEYIDSAPQSLAQRGQVGIRRYAGDKDTRYENSFLILEPVT